MKVNSHFIIQKVKGKVTLFDAEKSVLHTLNSTAATIYQGFQLRWNKTKIIKKLETQFKADSSTIKSDVEETIADMLEKKILVKGSA